MQSKRVRESKKVNAMVDFDSDEDEAAFYDALESMSGSIFIQNPVEKRSQKPPSLEETKDEFAEADDEPLERDMLPWLKDPNVKISIWAILKDNIGKDISKISVPVFFNDPTSLL
jgi:oxysterol-binding protein 1